VAGPRVRLGQFIDFERDDDSQQDRATESNDGVATVPWVSTGSVLTVETDPPDEYEYAVRIYDAERVRQLVAVIEIASPGNKDRPDKRNALVAKCAELLRAGVAVSVVDLVTVRRFNLYADLRAFIEHPDPSMRDDPPAVYAASCRWFRRGDKAVLESVAVPLMVGQRLPTLPLWLTEEVAVPLDLEASYEQACHDLWIP
jgi:hypothetical protein